MDPLLYVDAYSPYAYVGFDPINGWDPLGLGSYSFYKDDLEKLSDEVLRELLKGLSKFFQLNPEDRTLAGMSRGDLLREVCARSECRDGGWWNRAWDWMTGAGDAAGEAVREGVEGAGDAIGGVEDSIVQAGGDLGRAAMESVDSAGGPVGERPGSDQLRKVGMGDAVGEYSGTGEKTRKRLEDVADDVGQMGTRAALEYGKGKIVEGMAGAALGLSGKALQRLARELGYEVRIAPQRVLSTVTASRPSSTVGGTSLPMLTRTPEACGRCSIGKVAGSGPTTTTCRSGLETRDGPSEAEAIWGPPDEIR